MQDGNEYNMNRLIIFAIIAFNFLTSACQETETGIKPLYVQKYIRLVRSIPESNYKTDAEAIKAYSLYLNIPTKNLSLNIRFMKLIKIEMNEEHGLKPYEYTSFPRVINFPPLRYVFKTGDLLFAGTIGNKNESLRLFSWKDKKIINNPALPQDFNDDGRRIIFEGKWYDYEYYPKDKYYFIMKDDRKIIIEDFLKLPVLFKNGLYGPIDNESANIALTEGVEYFNKEICWDWFILYYNWKNKEIKRIIGLPATSMYNLFDLYLWNGITIDSKK